jgi:hypothetical protein
MQNNKYITLTEIYILWEIKLILFFDETKLHSGSFVTVENSSLLKNGAELSSKWTVKF